MGAPSVEALPGGLYHRSGPGCVAFGQPAGPALAAALDGLGARRVMLMTSPSPAALAARGEGPLPSLQRTLGDRWVGTWAGWRAHSPLPDVLAAAAAARDARADLLVAVGGGSVIDGCKAVLPCLWHGLSEASALRSVRHGGERAIDPVAADRGPILIAVPTLFSAAEFTARAGITDPDSGRKLSYRHADLVPRVAILDPACSLATPLPLLLASGMRAVDHAIESFCSPAAQAGGQLHARAGWQALHAALAGILRDPADLGWRRQAQFGLWQAILGATTGAGTGASHGIGYALGAAYGVSHGHTSCVMLPAVLRYNAVQDAPRQRDLASAVGRPDTPLAAIVATLVRDLGLPGRLRELGIGRHQWPELARHAMAYEPVGRNPRPIRDERDVMAILALADEDDPGA